jgi:RND family efflux transporter MFP subunit
MKKIIIILVLIALVVGAVYIVKKRKAELTSIKPSKRHSFHVQKGKVKKENFSQKDKFFGTVEAFNSANIISRVQGQITKIYKREGDIIKKGEKVLELDNLTGLKKSLKEKLSSLKKQLSNTNIIIENLQQSFDRDKKLYNSKAISLEMLQMSENRLKEAISKKDMLNSQISDIKTQISFFTIKSPFEGIVSKLFVKQGDIAMPGRPLVQVENTNKYKVVVTVDSANIRNIKQDGSAILIYNGKTINTRVSRVYPSLLMGKGTVEIDLKTKPFNLPTGSFIDVMIETQSIKNALTVPETALLRLEDNAYCYKLIDNNKVKPVTVKVLGISNGIAAIEGNLEPNDFVVTASETILLRLSKDSKVITE